MLVYIIGPSGVGKNFLLDRVKDRLPAGAIVIDLDKEEDQAIEGMDPAHHRGWEGRWERGLKTLHRFETSANHGIVIVGAGSLQTEAAFEYFAHRIEQVILVTADQEVLIKRRPRSLENLLQNEFTGAHKELYASIPRVIENGSNDSRDAEACLLDQIATVLGSRRISI